MAMLHCTDKGEVGGLSEVPERTKLAEEGLEFAPALLLP